MADEGNEQEALREEAIRRLIGAVEAAIPPRAPLYERLETALSEELRVLQPYRMVILSMIRRDPGLGSARIAALYRGLIADAIGRSEISRFTQVETAVGALWAFRSRVLAFWADDGSAGASDTHAQIREGIGFLVRRWGGATR